MRYRMMMMAAAFVAFGVTVVLGPTLAQQVESTVATLRGMAPLNQEAEPPQMPQTEDGAERRTRSYPEQPPTIPHSIDGYQVDRLGNRCLSCHNRSRVGESGAPMVSITHFMDRDGQFLAAVSPRRYFCTQCHVAQARVMPKVENDFVDVDTLLRNADAPK